MDLVVAVVAGALAGLLAGGIRFIKDHDIAVAIEEDRAPLDPEGVVKVARWVRGQQEASMRESILEMRIQALEEGKPLDPRALVVAAVAALTRATISAQQPAFPEDIRDCRGRRADWLYVRDLLNLALKQMPEAPQE